MIRYKANLGGGPAKVKGTCGFQALQQRQKALKSVHSRSTLPDTHYLRTHIWTWTNLHGHVCRHTRADLFETVIQIVDRDPAEGALLLAEEYSRSLKGKVELLQGFLHSAKDLV